MSEIDGSSPRAAILVGASVLEHYLTELLQAHLRQPENAKEKLYRPGEGQILTDFSDKIWMAYYLKMIGPQTRREIDSIREMRNKCAHDMNPLSFDTPGIFDRCKLLRDGRSAKALKENPNDYRAMFSLTVKMLMARVYLRTLTLENAGIRRSKNIKKLIQHIDV